MIEIATRRSFEAAHSLPMMPQGHKCRRLHGHNYEIEVVLRGELNAAGIVFDYGALDGIVDELIIKVVDHQHLNGIHGLENPTGENIALWSLRRLQTMDLPLFSVTIWETPHYRATVCVAHRDSAEPRCAANSGVAPDGLG